MSESKNQVSKLNVDVTEEQVQTPEPEEKAISDLVTETTGEEKPKARRSSPRKRAKKPAPRKRKQPKQTAPVEKVSRENKNKQAEVTAMFNYWKRVHEISGNIMGSLEEYSKLKKPLE